MRHGFWVICTLALVLPAGPLRGQEVSGGMTAALPDAPSFARSADPTAGDEAASTGSPSSHRWLNFDGKLRYFREHSFGPGALLGPLFTAGPEMVSPPKHYPKPWRQGAAGFGRLYGDALAFQTAAETSRFLTGAAFHEDPRYSRSASHNPLLRTMHAVAFTAFDNSDSGHTTLALSNFAGAASAGLVGNAYLPGGYNDTRHAVTRTGIAFGSFALTNLSVEFSPELRRMGRGLHLPKFLLSRQPEKSQFAGQRSTSSW